MYSPQQVNSGKPASNSSVIISLAIVLLLVLILLFVLTKFSFISCNDVPGWCPIYCSIAGRDRIAIIYSSNGSGSYNDLYSKLSGQGIDENYSRLYNQIYKDKALSLDKYDLNEISETIMKKYDLLVFTNAKEVSPTQLQDIQNYLVSGGKIIITGDSLSQVKLSKRDLDALLTKNKSIEGSYEKTVGNSYRILGFGDLGRLGKFSYIGPGSGPADFSITDSTYPPLKGLTTTIPGIKTYIRVNYASGTLVPAFITSGEDRDPAIIETKVGTSKLVYVAFPLEDFPSPLLGLNLIDYYSPCTGN